MPEQAVQRETALLSVGFRAYDGALRQDSLFAQVRRVYFSSLRNASGKISAVEDGAEVCVRYKIGKGTFRWLKTGGKSILQKAYPEKEGYSVVTWDSCGEIIAKSVFSGAHVWLRTSYYSGSTETPAALLQPGQSGGMILLQQDAEHRKYHKTDLIPCPYSPGTAAQSFVDSAAGEPQLFGQTEERFFCYCTREECEQRTALLRNFQSGQKTALPQWPQDAEGTGETVAFQFVTNSDLPCKEPKKERGACEGNEPKPPAPVPRDYAVNHELFSIEVPKPMEYSVAAKGLDCGTVVGPAVAPGVQRAAKRIVVSEEESYLYFGKVIDGLRQGRGRTQMQSGATAYEGGYVDDMRHGFGVYYYKSGKLCYAGSWKENQREGLGVAFRSADDSIFIGKWKNNIPTGQGTAFDAEGNLIYSGEWENGKRHGHGTEYQDGKIVFTGEFLNDRRLPQKKETAQEEE